MLDENGNLILSKFNPSNKSQIRINKLHESNDNQDSSCKNKLKSLIK